MSVTGAADHDALDQLLLRSARQDAQAFTLLYEATSSRLFGICLRMLADRREAEEVLQEAFVAVWQRAASFQPDKAHAMAWLVTLTRNKAIDRLRQHGEAKFDGETSFGELVDQEPTPANQAERSQQYRRLDDCMKELEPEQRRSVREAFFSGATYSELATRASVPLGTMKSWIRRSLLQLRACLNA